MAIPHDRTSALDGIRGIAALAVLFFHCGLHMHASWFVGHGSLAVDVFFCMSGFVVERAYGDRLRANWSVAAFARVRFQRLYPLYAMGLALGAVMHFAVHAWLGTPVSRDVVGREIVLGALLIPSLDGGVSQIFPLNAPSWSLFVEACVNVGFAFMPRRFGTAMIVVLSATVVMTAAFARLRLTYGGLSDTLWLDLARGGFGFGVGVLMSHLHRRQAFVRVPCLTTPLVFALLAVLVLVPRGPHDLWFDPAAILLLCPALVALGVASHPSREVARWSARAGALSYPLYVVHAPIIDAAVKLVPEGSAAPASRALALAAAAVAALALAAVIARRAEARLARTSTLRAPDAARPSLTTVRVRG